jgi:hypothetical protein
MNDLEEDDVTDHHSETNDDEYRKQFLNEFKRRDLIEKMKLDNN